MIRRRAFTLMELLVVIVIIMIVSILALSQILPAINQRKITSGASLLQAALVGARDAAISANAPRGIRLLPDPAYKTPANTAVNIVASNRWVAIEPAPNYSDGAVTITPGVFSGPWLVLYAEPNGPGGLVNPPTSWAWNIRVGDKLSFGTSASSQTYTIVGPVMQANAEQFINYGPPGTPARYPPSTGTVGIEYLFLVNGQDDNGDGYVDESWDGIDQNLNGITDYPNEIASGLTRNGGKGDTEGDSVMTNAAGQTVPLFETEQWLSAQSVTPVTSAAYVIQRRPVPVQGARETVLPQGIVIDLTTCGTTNERSRLPMDPNTFTVDVLIQPNGQVQVTTLYGAPSVASAYPFFHFWLTEREGLNEPQADPKGKVAYTLPMPVNTPPAWPDPNDTIWGNSPLKGERRLVTLFTRSGNIAINNIEPAILLDPTTKTYTSGFRSDDINQPYLDAQSGVRAAP